MIRLIDQALLAEVSAEAQVVPRRRKNRNFHPRDDYPCHRLLNAVEPDSYVMPHRHLDPNKDETILCLRGKLGILIFSPNGTVHRSSVLEAGGDTVGVDIPHGVFHAVVALESGTVFFEAKAGPYLPLSPEEKAPWAPLEGSGEAVVYLATLRAKFS